MDEKHPKNIDKRPKRRKDRDNPYEIFTVGINTDNPHYYTSFVDNHGVQMCIEIQKELFDVLNQFESGFVIHQCDNDISLVCGVLLSDHNKIAGFDSCLYHGFSSCTKNEKFTAAEYSGRQSHIQ